MTDQQAYRVIHKQVRRAQNRLNIFMIFCFWLRMLFYILVAEAVVFAALKFTPWTLPVLPSFSAAVGVSVVIAFFLFWQNRKTLSDTAIMVDKHLKLKEKISSALDFSLLPDDESYHTEWKNAQLFDALKETRRLDLRKAFPFQAPFEGRWLWAPAMALFLIAYVIPQWQLFTGDMASLANAGMIDKKEIEKQTSTLIQRQLQIEKREQGKEMEEASKLAKEVKELAEKLSKGKVEKREALAKISSLENKWEERKEELMAMQNQHSRPMPISQMKLAGDLAKNIQSGDFKKAAEALQEMQKQLKMENLSNEEKERLSKELKQVASAMDAELPFSNALNNAALELSQGDISDALSSLKMSEMTMKDLQEMLKQMALLNEACKNLSECKMGVLGKCTNCGSSACNGNGQCQSLAQNTSPWKAGFSENQGNGMGGPGIGRGGQAQFEENDVAFNKSTLNGEFQQAPISGLLKVKGMPFQGESFLTAQDTGISQEQQQEDAVVKEHVPVPYRHHVHAYFDSLNTQSQ